MKPHRLAVLIIILFWLVMIWAFPVYAGCTIIVLPDGSIAQQCCFPNGNCQIIR